jgi:hypothetical protein
VHPLGIDEDDWRDYLFADAFGWTPLEVAEIPAVKLDWLLAIRNVVEGVRNRDRT